MCAKFMWFLSIFSAFFATGIVLMWHWFGSSHGKSDCDPEGGAFKARVAQHERTGKPGERNHALRTTLDVARWAREDEKRRKRRADGGGVFRRWIHFIPMQGFGCLRQRARVKDAEQQLRRITRVEDGGVQVDAVMPTRSIRRVLANGWKGIIKASREPCAKCAACCDRRYQDCDGMEGSKMVELQVSVKHAAEPMELRRARARQGSAYVELARKGAAQGADLAFETFDDETTYMIVKPLAGLLQAAHKTETLSTPFGIDFRVKKGELLLNCQRYLPRSPHSTTALVLEPAGHNSFFVPAVLCRGEVALVAHEPAAVPRPRRSARRRRGAAPAQPPRSQQPRPWWELTEKEKTKVLDVCRLH